MIPAVAFLATIPFYVGAVTSSSLAVSFALFLVPTALGLVWLGPVLSSIQHVVPPRHARHRVGDLPVRQQPDRHRHRHGALGALSDALVVRHGADSLRYAILYGTAFYVIASTLFLLSARRLERDWHD